MTGTAASRRDLEVSVEAGARGTHVTELLRLPSDPVLTLPAAPLEPAATCGSRGVICDPGVLLALEGFLLEAGGCAAVEKNRIAPAAPPFRLPSGPAPARPPRRCALEAVP